MTCWWNLQNQDGVDKHEILCRKISSPRERKPGWIMWRPWPVMWKTSSTTSCITRIGCKFRVSTTLGFWINHLHSQEYLCEASNCSKIKKEPFCIMILDGWKVMATLVFSSKMSCWDWKCKMWLLGWFLTGKPWRSVISLAGMGGLGKITLVATNYNSQVEVVRPHFDWYAWITLSQSYVIEDLLW